MLFFSNSSTAQKTESVTITSKTEDAKIYINNKLVGEGPEVNADIDINLDVHQVKIEKEGYKTEYAVLSKAKKKWLSSPSTLSVKTKVFNKSDKQKYIYIKNTDFVIDAGNYVYEYYNFNEYVGDKIMLNKIVGSKNLETENNYYRQRLNKILSNYGFIDSTKTLFKSKVNTAYINSTVSKITHKKVYCPNEEDSYSVFFTSTITIKWELLDFYGQVLFEKEIKTTSGKFSTNFYKNLDVKKEERKNAVALSMEDAIQTSFFKFLNNETALKYLELKEEKKELLVLPAPNTITNLQEAKQATVTIKNGKGSHGSGCFISNNGYVVTNFHVVADAELNKLKIITHDGNEYIASMLRNDFENDLALIKIELNNTHAFTIPNQKSYEIGQDVYAIGTPESIELGQSISKGIVSGVRKNDGIELIQSDVSVNAGNSGGALVNKSGQLVGIVNWKLAGFGVEGISFITPAHMIMNSLYIDYK